MENGCALHAGRELASEVAGLERKSPQLENRLLFWFVLCVLAMRSCAYAPSQLARL